MGAVSEIAKILRDRVDEVIPQLLPRARRNGNYWSVGDVYGTPGGSLIIDRSGPRMGRWRDLNSGEGGDILNLIEAGLSLDLEGALEWSRQWHLGGPVVGTARELGDRMSQKPYDGKKMARAIWDEARVAAGSLAESYLKSRRVPFPTWCADVRFHPNCPFGPERRPAMVCAVRNIRTDEFQGIHRTPLLPDGSDYDRALGKKALGPCGGGAVKLFDDADVTDSLGVGEGIESTLGLIPFGVRPVWSLINAGGLSRFPTLAGIENLTIAMDNDESGAGEKASFDCGLRWQNAGRDVRIIRPKVKGEDQANIVQRIGA